MKYKLLLCGSGKMIMDDFFNHLDHDFDLISTSTRLNDMTRHLELFEPDLFVYCLNNDARDDLIKLNELKRYLVREDVRTVIIGSEDDCEDFRRITNNLVDLVLTKPITINIIKESIIDFMESVEKEREEQRIMQKKLEMLKKMQERKHVLVVDDDPVLLKLIKEHLHEKYDVATAISGKLARKFLEMKKTHFILLDYEMPGESGIDVLKWIRENPIYDDIPVVFLTGTTDKSKIVEALSLNPQGYLLKPIDKDKLIGTIEKFIG